MKKRLSYNFEDYAELEGMSVFVIRKIKDIYSELVKVEKEAEKEVVKIMSEIRESCLFKGGNLVDNYCNIMRTVIEENNLNRNHPAIQGKRTPFTMYENIQHQRTDEKDSFSIKQIIASINNVNNVRYIDFEHDIVEMNSENVALTIDTITNAEADFVENLFYHFDNDCKKIEQTTVNEIVQEAKSFRMNGLYLYEFLVRFKQNRLFKLRTEKRDFFRRDFDEEVLLEALKNTARMARTNFENKNLKVSFKKYDVFNSIRQAIDSVKFNTEEKEEAETYYEEIKESLTT